MKTSVFDRKPDAAQYVKDMWHTDATCAAISGILAAVYKVHVGPQQVGHYGRKIGLGSKPVFRKTQIERNQDAAKYVIDSRAEGAKIKEILRILRVEYNMYVTRRNVEYFLNKHKISLSRKPVKENK